MDRQIHTRKQNKTNNRAHEIPHIKLNVEPHEPHWNRGWVRALIKQFIFYLWHPSCHSCCSVLCDFIYLYKIVVHIYIKSLLNYHCCLRYQDFLDRWLLLTRKLLNHGLLLVKLKSTLQQVLPPWLCWPLWNICVTNDHGFALLVSISRSFPHSWLITGLELD